MIDGIASRESSILHMLFDSFAPSLYGKILAVVKDPDVAIRILEKTLVYSVRHIRQHNPHIRLHNWLLQIANFKIMEEAASVVVGRGLPEDLDWDSYAEAWSGLHAEEKEVLDWSTIRAVSHEETAISLELPLELLQLRISTALAHFHVLVSSLVSGRMADRSDTPKTAN